jgi:hypothetical protein
VSTSLENTVEQVAKKLPGFFDKEMRQLFEFELRHLI